MDSGSLLLLAGPNGAGKSTLIQAVREELGLTSYVSLNADERTLQKIVQAGFSGFDDTSLDVTHLRRLFIESATEIYEEALALLKAGKNVCLETVLSTDKYCQLVEDIGDEGGMVELVYVALRSSDISRQRVKLRVRKHGHDVPADRLQERWERSLSYLPWFARRADNVVVYDNSEDVPIMVAKGSSGTMRWLVPKDLVFPELRLALESEFPELKQV